MRHLGGGYTRVCGKMLVRVCKDLWTLSVCLCAPQLGQKSPLNFVQAPQLLWWWWWLRLIYLHSTRFPNATLEADPEIYHNQS